MPISTGSKLADAIIVLVSLGIGIAFMVFLSTLLPNGTDPIKFLIDPAWILPMLLIGIGVFGLGALLFLYPLAKDTTDDI